MPESQTVGLVIAGVAVVAAAVIVGVVVANNKNGTTTIVETEERPRPPLSWVDYPLYWGGGWSHRGGHWGGGHHRRH